MREDKTSKEHLIKGLKNARQSISEIKKSVSKGNQTDEDLKESEQIFRTIFENAPDGILLADNESKKFFMGNKQIYKALGYGPDEIKALGVMDIHPEKDLPYILDQFEKLIRNDIGVAKDIPVKKKDGSIYYADISALPITLMDKTYLVGIFRDITERMLVEDALRESEEKYRTILDIMEEGYAEVDLNGTCTFVNNACCALMGYERDEMIGMNYKSYSSPETAHFMFDVFHRVYKTGKPEFMVDHDIIIKDGIIRTHQASVALMKDHSGHPIGFNILVRDVTDRKKVENALRESEKSYRMITENVHEAIWIMDFDLHSSYISPSIVRISGFTPEELKKIPLYKQVTPESYALVEKKLADLLAIEESGEPVDPDRLIIVEAELIRKGGGTVWVEVAASVKRDENGKAIGILGVSREITDRKKAEEERARLEAQLVQAQKMESIGTLAGGIAHDFNNLLTGILGNISLALMSMDDSNPLRERLKNVEEYVQRGSGLTKQLLGFARGGKYEVKPTNLGKFIMKSSEMFGRTKKEIHIHNKAQEGLWVVEVDWGQMEQVLLNLYVNAWQAMTGGGDLYLSVENVELGTMEVVPYDIRPGKFVKITVTDNGAGMDEATKERIFEPFYTTKERERGTGLGLASVYGIVKNHGGFVQVESEKGIGTSFMIYLPVSDKVVAEEHRPKDEVQMGQETILLIDDEKMIIDIGTNMLEGLGYKVIPATGGRKGLQIYEKDKDKINLVILDMIMPDFSGKETYKALRRINQSVCVLLSSGYSLDLQTEEIMKSGCKGFIQKPFTMVELSKKIREILDEH